MVAAFATAADLAARLGREVWTGTELAQVNALLEDASAYLRSEIGWQVSPPATVTTTVRNTAESALRLPGFPVVEVTGVTVDGTAFDASGFELVDGVVHRRSGVWWGTTVVTYTVGYETVPDELVTWTCVLAAEALPGDDDTNAGGSYGQGRLRSDAETVGSYSRSRSWETTADRAAFHLPDRVLERLRASFGAGAFVTG